MLRKPGKLQAFTYLRHGQCFVLYGRPRVSSICCFCGLIVQCQLKLLPADFNC
jgi:hypothetical protein